jgi:hypothetical protein
MVTVWSNRKLNTPEWVKQIDDPYKADYVIQAVFNCNDIDELSQGAILLIFSMKGETVDFWEYVFKKAKRVFSKRGVGIKVTDWKEIWRYIK